MLQMPLPVQVTNPQQIPTFCLTWGRWGMILIGALAQLEVQVAMIGNYVDVKKM